MPAWTGGPCPECGDDMPPLLVHCQTCHGLLNKDLVEHKINAPPFEPLKEITKDEYESYRKQIAMKQQ